MHERIQVEKSSQSAELSVCLAVLTFNRDEECTRALSSALQFGFKEILVLDNGSENRFESDLGRVIRSSKNTGVSAGRNRLVAETTCDLVLFLDDDAVLDESTDLSALVSEFSKNPDLSVIAGLFQRPDGVASHEFPSRRLANLNQVRNVGYFVGGAAIVRKSDFVAIGGFDEQFFYGHEESDYSLRLARRGKLIQYNPALFVRHLPSLDGRLADNDRILMGLRNRIILCRKNLPVVVRLIHIGVWSMLTFRQLVGLNRVRAIYRTQVAAWRMGVSCDSLGFIHALRLFRAGYRIFF